jgi:hypothetical protein
MKIGFLLFSLSLTVSLMWKKQPSPVTFSFVNSKWTFPSTIGEAVENYHFHFKPPGYYYLEYPNDLEVVLLYDYIFGELENDRQSKETLYSKKIHTYYFRFPDHGKTYDSLRYAIEKQYNNKFTLRSGARTPSFFDEPPSNYSDSILNVNSSLSIGIKRIKSSGKWKDIVGVYFLYGLSEQKQLKAMGSM